MTAVFKNGERENILIHTHTHIYFYIGDLYES